MASTPRARVRQPDWSVYAEDTDAVLAWLRGLDSGSASCEHMTAEDAPAPSAACARRKSTSSETGWNQS